MESSRCYEVEWCINPPLLLGTRSVEGLRPTNQSFDFGANSMAKVDGISDAWTQTENAAAKAIYLEQ